MLMAGPALLLSGLTLRASRAFSCVCARWPWRGGAGCLGKGALLWRGRVWEVWGVCVCVCFGAGGGFGVALHVGEIAACKVWCFLLLLLLISLVVSCISRH
jgi:hypothetical protein